MAGWRPRSIFLCNFPLRKGEGDHTVAENATVDHPFAFAAGRAASQKDRAFQASSPKNFKAAFRGGFFLPLFQGRVGWPP